MAQLTVASDERELAELAAERVTQLIEEAVGARGAAVVSLAGGTTPRRLYSNLADPDQSWRDRIPWPRVHLFWGDDRQFPPDHPDSNYGMAKAAMIDHVPIPADHVHRIRSEMPDARDAAADYERTIADVVSAFRGTTDVVSGFSLAYRFDLMLLGLGEDAHIASIFPGSALLNSGHSVAGHQVAAVWAPHLNAWRVTLTPETILDSQLILVLVAGGHKADAVYAALDGPPDVKVYPAQVLRAADNRVSWFIDRAAASRM